MSKKNKILTAISLTIITLFAISFFFPVNKSKLKTDSGFDSSWDSGGSWDSGSSSSSWGSSSSWDSDSSWGSGSYSGGSGGFLLYLTVYVFIIIMIVSITSTSKRNTSGEIDFEELKKQMMVADYKDILLKHNISKLEIVESAKNIIKKLEMAYSYKNLSSVVGLVSDKVINEYQSKIDNLKDNKLFINSLNVKDTFIYSVNEIDNKLIISMDLVLEMMCVIKDEKSSVKEDEYVPKMYRYVFDLEYFGNYYLNDIKEIREIDKLDYDAYSVIQRNHITDKLNELGLTKENVLEEAYRIYVDVQKAWMEDKLESVKEIISDEIYNTYSAQLATLRIKKQQNIMDNFAYVDGFITSITSYNNCSYIRLLLCVKCKDYLISKESEKVIRGSSSIIHTYRYSLTFMISSETIERCPSCGAKLLERGASVKCEYCGSDINRYSKNLVLTDKKMISQN